MTARQAIQELRAEGRVVAERRAGRLRANASAGASTRIRRFARKHREAGQAAFLAEAEGRRSPAWIRSRSRAVEPPADVRERLRLADGDAVVGPRLGGTSRMSGRLRWRCRSCRSSIAKGTPMVEHGAGRHLCAPGGGRPCAGPSSKRSLHACLRQTSAGASSCPTAFRCSSWCALPTTRLGLPVEVCDTVKAAPAYVLEYDVPAR